jgi:hypothetical protein
MEHWWSDAERVEPKSSEKSQFQCHFVNQKSQTDWLKIKLSFCVEKPAVENLRHGPTFATNLDSHGSQ